MIKAWRARRRLRRDEAEAYEMQAVFDNHVKYHEDLDAMRRAMFAEYCPIMNDACCADCGFYHAGHVWTTRISAADYTTSVDYPRCKLCQK